MNDVEKGRDFLDISLLIQDPVSYIKTLDEDGDLEKIFPAVSLTKGVRQSEIKHNEGDVFTHTLLTLERLNQETLSDKEYGAIQDENDLYLLFLALLYHDTGKRERNLNDDPENPVFHVNESMVHAERELKDFVSAEDLDIVLELIKKHEAILEAEHISYRINKLFKLFSLGGDLSRGRLLLKFAECDITGRRIAEGHDYLLKKNDYLQRRNIELYNLLRDQEKLNGPFPLQRIARETVEKIKGILANVLDKLQI